MSKHKTITHLPPAPAPRLAAQLLVAIGELMTVVACVLGIVTAAVWLFPKALPSARPPAPPPMVCWYDLRYGETCWADRPPVRRHFVRE
jgi:hypothetical protein